MKATFEFNLPEEQSEYDLYSNAPNFQSAIFEIQRHFKEILKYNPDEHSEEYLKAYEDFKRRVYAIMNSYGIEA